jgi:MtN3 and saliva related transmembrane protein
MDINWAMLIGLSAATLTTIGFIPQAFKIIKTRNTRDISLTMYIIMALGVSCWLIYGILIIDLPVILANTVTSVFIYTILFLKVKYK